MAKSTQPAPNTGGMAKKDAKAELLFQIGAALVIGLIWLIFTNGAVNSVLHTEVYEKYLNAKGPLPIIGHVLMGLVMLYLLVFARWVFRSRLPGGVQIAIIMVPVVIALLCFIQFDEAH